MTFRQLLVVCASVAVLILIAACSSTVPTPTPAPTVVVAKPTSLPPPTPTPTSENCVKCHTNQDTLKKLAVNKVVKSEATEGEG